LRYQHAADLHADLKRVKENSLPLLRPKQPRATRRARRHDIFSFGSVLYEMITGRRAFSGESRASTLANRGSQSMADVKLALEELREEAESRGLTRSTTSRRRWVWPAIAAALAISLAAVLSSNYLDRNGSHLKRAGMTMRTPDDSRIYKQATSSANLTAKVPAPAGYVTDVAKVVDPGTKHWLEEYLKGLEQRHGAQVGILTVETLQGEPIEAFALTVFRSWGVGRQDENDGLLLVLATQDHTTRLTVGSGLDYLFTSELCQRIFHK
jgi:hypothetical protein